jgi:predicted MFS family arabinose efflux permease
VVSEVGDHFNNIAVFSLALAHTQSGLAVTGVMLARAIPAVIAGPIAGVTLDRLDRKQVMIASDLVRFVVALGFLLTLNFDAKHSLWLLYALSGMLMFASPFFTSGRAAILPSIASREELHAANSLTQTTQWASLAIGTFAGGTVVAGLGFAPAFVLNAASFLFSALAISRLRAPAANGFRAAKKALTESDVLRPWHEYVEGLRYMRATPLILGIALISVGWATGGGAAQILFSLFGELVFHRGPAGIGYIWGCAAIGLLIGGGVGHWLGKRVTFDAYKRTIIVCYVIHGSTYIVFSQMESFGWALVFIAISRAAVAVTSVLNFSQLLRHVANDYRGRVFSTVESMTWSTMMLSMMAAGIASQYYSPRTIGAVSGALSSTTAIFWCWAHLAGKLPEPKREGIDPREVEVHGEQTV